MTNKRSNDPRLMERATSTDNLKERANINLKYGSGDFEGWVDSLLGRVEFESVLDVCCGTGNQLVTYAKLNRNAALTGVDVSQKSLQTADERLKELGATAYRLKAVGMEELFDDPEYAAGKFDLISCFYGLYYSRNAAKTLTRMIAHLSDRGYLLIVGPHGKNNAALFDILQQHFPLPELVVRSSSTFMEQEVFPVLSAVLTVTSKTFVNPVRYPTPQVVIDYWKSSTFYSEPHERAVIRDIETHFARQGEFVMEKHVIAYLARKT